MIKLHAVAIFSLAMAIDSSVCAFICKSFSLITSNFNSRSRQAIFAIEATPKTDKYLKLFNVYITKSREEKQKVIKDAEDRKNIEIKIR